MCEAMTAAAGSVGVAAIGAVLWFEARRRSLRRAALDAGAAVARCPHAWMHRSTEQTNGRPRRIYVCVACDAREIREGPES